MTTDPQAPKPNQDVSEPDKEPLEQKPAEAPEVANQEFTEGADKTVPSESADATVGVTDAVNGAATIESAPINSSHDEDSATSDLETDTAQENTEPAQAPSAGVVQLSKESATTGDSTDNSPESASEGSTALSTHAESPEETGAATNGTTDDTSGIAVAVKAQQPAVLDGKQNIDDDEDEDYDEEDEEDEYEEDDEEDDDDTAEHGRMSLFDHLRELKKRLVRAFIAIFVGFLICYAFAEKIFNFLVRPLLAVLPKGSKLIYTGLPEAFFTYMKVAFVAGCFLASPVVFYQIWAFIAPGLYDEEKRHILPVAICSAIFFILGGAFAYFIAFPFAFEFFMSYSTDVIEAQPRLSEYLSFSLQLLFAFGLIFELPLFTFFLAKMGLVTAAAMRKFRRYAILVNFIVAAILTPPDVMSQMLMAVPLLALYEISIIVAQVFGKKSKEPVKRDEEDESADDATDEEDEEEDEDADDNPATSTVAPEKSVNGESVDGASGESVDPVEPDNSVKTV